MTLLTGSLVVALVAAEIAVRQLLPRPGAYRFPQAEVDGVFQPDSARGYAYRPHLRREVVVGSQTVEFATNELGMRDDPNPAEDPGARILAVGNSFTQGHGVSVEHSWPRKLQEQLPGVRVLNAGVSGYGLQQMRATAELLIPELGPDLLVVGVYARGYWRVTNPVVLVGDGRGLMAAHNAARVVVDEDDVLYIPYRREAVRALDLWLKRHWYFGAHLLGAAGWTWGRAKGMFVETPDYSPDAGFPSSMDPMLDELHRTAELARSEGVPMVALLINPQSETAMFEPREWMYNYVITRFAEEHEIWVVDPLPEMARSADGTGRFRLGPDYHWSPEAHALAADLLAPEVRQLLAPDR